MTIVYSEVALQQCIYMNVPYYEYVGWTKKAQDWKTLRKLIDKNINLLMQNKKPQIDYDVEPKLTKSLFKNIFDKINATTRY